MPASTKILYTFSPNTGKVCTSARTTAFLPVKNLRKISGIIPATPVPISKTLVSVERARAFVMRSFESIINCFKNQVSQVSK